MDREKFKEMIKSLSFYEENDSGSYLSANQAMSDIHMRTSDSLQSFLSHSYLKNMLRLIIHAQFSVRPFHYDEFISVHYVYEGKLELKFPDETVTLYKGQVFIINAKVIYSFEVEGEHDLILGLQIEKEYLGKKLLPGLSEFGPVTDFLVNILVGKDSGFSYLIAEGTQDGRMETIFEDLFCEHCKPSICSGLQVENYVRIFFVLLIRCSNSRIKMDTKADILAILNYIEGHCTNCSLQTLSNQFNLNPKYLSVLIRKMTGRSFSELQLGVRMQSACYYLKQSELTVREIAELCGYTNMNFFYRKFQELYGVSPKQYRVV